MPTGAMMRMPFAKRLLRLSSLKKQPARAIPHDKAKYKWRNQIERLFNKLKNWRRLATRYDKTKESYLGFVAIAAVKLWIPFVHER